MTAAPWWRHASVYQLYVRSFADSNGDGIGDLRGIRDRLPHIASLGVDAIWLNPCYPSPQIDHGYDVADYFAIEPDYGDLSEFDALVAAAREHGIRILMDVVPNHCSWEHELFKAAIAAGPGSKERQRFYFRPGKGEHGELPPNNWVAIFGGSAWTRVTEPNGEPGEWYLAVFTPAQPDWNFEHPDVIDHFDRMLRFWFDRGVEGFRADAVTVLGKTPGLPDWEGVGGGAWEPNPHFTWLASGHVAWRHWRDVVNAYERDHPGRDLLLVAEAYTPARPDLMLEYANPQEFHQSFAFDLMLSPWRPNMLRGIVDGTLSALRAADQLPAWTLNNHDSQRTTTRYGRADAADRNELAPGSISNTRVPVDETLGLRRARAAVVFELALPGCVYLYAGEELGLPEVLDLPDSARQDPVFHNTGGDQYGRDGCRVPLPWSRDAAGSYGFSPTASTASPWLPQPAWWGEWSVEAQADDAASTLTLYRTAGALRRSDPGLASESFAWIDGFGPDVVAFFRGDTIVVLNTMLTPRPLDASIVGARTVLLSSLHGHTDPLVVPANSTLWLR